MASGRDYNTYGDISPAYVVIGLETAEYHVPIGYKWLTTYKLVIFSGWYAYCTYVPRIPLLSLQKDRLS